VAAKLSFNLADVGLIPVAGLEDLEDYQSRSSVLPAKVLAKFYWMKSFNWENTCNDFQNISIKGKTAGVVIGDRVFDIEKKYRYIYDLSEYWYKCAGLPFVFAVWQRTKRFLNRLRTILTGYFRTEMKT
jgi:predicted solute-binding protein